MTTEEVMRKAYEIFCRKFEYRKFIGCGEHPVLTAGEAIALGLEMYRLGKEDQE